MKLIVGLGNPGARYDKTRHNAGFIIIDMLAERFQIKWDQPSDKFLGVTAKGNVHNSPVILLKPNTFMNISGESVQKVLHFFKIPPEDMIVLHDDIDLPNGKVKVRMDGGHGGHNGIRSIVEKTGSNDFQRVKLGVGKPPPEIPMDVSSWVLAPFAESEMAHLCTEMFKEVLARLENLVLR